MITCDNGRMLEFLWFVGFCEEFPSQLASRIGGHPEWNRHVKYRAIQRGYVEVFKGNYRRRVIRSLRLTEAGLDYICTRDPRSAAYLLSKENNGIPTTNRLRYILRLHALATGLVMAHNTGAVFLPDQKPSLLLKASTRILPDAHLIYYYSAGEIRAAIQELEPDSVAKTSRIVGIVIHGARCFCLYHTGHSRMYWQRFNEENTVAAIETLLLARGFNCTSFSQVIIATNSSVAVKIAKQRVNGQSRYFTVSSAYNSCFFVENNAYGDNLLSLIVNPKKQAMLNQRILEEYAEPTIKSRSYDAVTKDGLRPVVLAYPFDLLALLNTDPAPRGFAYSPILLCFDYQAEAMQSIVGPKIEVRTCIGGETIEQEKLGKDP